MEESKEKRTKYQIAIRDILKQDLVYIDESGIDMNTCQDKGWSKKGEKLMSKKSGKYYERINVIAALVNNKPIAPGVFTSSCDTSLFETLVEKFLILGLKPSQVVVMDNTFFHKSPRIKS